MATVIWMAVFMLLMVELVIAAILVLPLPRFLRKFIARTIFAYDLGRRVRFISNFIILGLVLAVSDAVNTIRHLELKDEAADSSGSYGDRGAGFVNASFDKQRKFRAERNLTHFHGISGRFACVGLQMYLAGFALTLMFAIARIVELMQSTVNAEDEAEMLKKRLKEVDDVASRTTTVPDVTDDSPIGAPGSTPYTLRKRSVTSTETDKAD